MNDPILESCRHDPQALQSELAAIGARFRGKSCNCPFHADAHASAGIYADSNGVWRFKCHAAGCGFGGDLFDVRARAERRPLGEILAAGDTGSSQSVSSMRPSTDARIFASLQDLEAAIPHRVATYCYTNPDSRQIDMVVLRYEPPNGPKKFIQAQPHGDGFVMKAPLVPRPLYNRVRLRDTMEVLMVEGEKVVDALDAIGIVATTTPGGAGKAGHADLTPLAGKHVVLWPDNDRPNPTRMPNGRPHPKPGHRTGIDHMKDVADRLQRLSPPAMVRWIDPLVLSLPEKGDAADYLVRLGTASVDTKRDAIAALMKSATILSEPSGTAAGCDLSDDCGSALESTTNVVPARGGGEGESQDAAEVVLASFQAEIDGRRRLVHWPWPAMSRLTLSLLPETLTLLVGYPGAGKSIALSQALAAWHNANIPASLLALEDSKAYHLRRLLAQRCGESRLTDPEWVSENGDFVKAAVRTNAGFLAAIGRCLYVGPTDRQARQEDLIRWAQGRAAAGDRIICIDPVTAVEATDTPWAADGRFLAAIKRITERSGASVVMVTHPRKGNQSEACMNELAGSAAYSRFSQTILWLDAPAQPKEVTVKTGVGGGVQALLPMERVESVNRILRVVKARNGAGTGFSIGFQFDPQSLTFSERGVIVKRSRVRGLHESIA